MYSTIFLSFANSALLPIEFTHEAQVISQTVYHYLSREFIVESNHPLNTSALMESMTDYVKQCQAFDEKTQAVRISMRDGSVDEHLIRLMNDRALLVSQGFFFVNQKNESSVNRMYHPEPLLDNQMHILGGSLRHSVGSQDQSQMDELTRMITRLTMLLASNHRPLFT